jgi:hypothetical protein
MAPRRRQHGVFIEESFDHGANAPLRRGYGCRPIAKNARTPIYPAFEHSVDS